MQLYTLLYVVIFFIVESKYIEKIYKREADISYLNGLFGKPALSQNVETEKENKDEIGQESGDRLIQLFGWKSEIPVVMKDTEKEMKAMRPILEENKPMDRLSGFFESTSRSEKMDEVAVSEIVGAVEKIYEEGVAVIEAVGADEKFYDEGVAVIEAVGADEKHEDFVGAKDTYDTTTFGEVATLVGTGDLGGEIGVNEWRSGEFTTESTAIPVVITTEISTMGEFAGLEVAECTTTGDVLQLSIKSEL